MSKAKKIMFQGTGSSVGKSLICAAMCRILADQGLKVLPFKAQNMIEIGRASCRERV